MSKIKIAGVTGAIILGLALFANAQTSPEFALRQQMIDFAKYFPNLVSQYYPDTPKVSQSGSPILGSVTNTEVLQNNFAVGGVREWSERKPLISNASTTCSFKLTTASTSMLVAANAIIASSSTGGVFEIGYNPLSAFSTSTLITQKTVSVSATDAVIATSSFSFGLPALTPANTLQPGGFINFKYQGAGTVSGFCEYKVREL